MKHSRHFGFWNSGCIPSAKTVSTCNKYFHQASVSLTSWPVPHVPFSCSLLPSTQQGLPGDNHAVLCPAWEGCSPDGCEPWWEQLCQETGQPCRAQRSRVPVEVYQHLLVKQVSAKQAQLSGPIELQCCWKNANPPPFLELKIDLFWLLPEQREF